MKDIWMILLFVGVWLALQHGAVRLGRHGSTRHGLRTQRRLNDRFGPGGCACVWPSPAFWPPRTAL